MQFHSLLLGSAQAPPMASEGPVVVSVEWDVAPGAALVVGARAEGAAAGLVDWPVVDAGLTAGHRAVVGELPQFVAVGGEPQSFGVVPFVLEADGHAVVAKPSQALAQGVVEFAFPLGGEELDNLFAAGEEDITVTPGGVLGVGASSAAWTLARALSRSKATADARPSWHNGPLLSAGLIGQRRVVVGGGDEVGLKRQQTAGDEMTGKEVDAAAGAVVVAGYALAGPFQGGAAGQVEGASGGEVEEEQGGAGIDPEVAQGVEQVVARVVRPPQSSVLDAYES